MEDIPSRCRSISPTTGLRCRLRHGHGEQHIGWSQDIHYHNWPLSDDEVPQRSGGIMWVVLVAMLCILVIGAYVVLVVMK